MTLLTLIKPVHWPTIVSLLLVVSVLLWPDIASAQENAGPIKSLLYFIIMSLTGWMLWMGGILLDYGVNTFVINFGINFNTNGVGVAVNQLWVIVRDLFNILFIFGLVYIGFKMILNSDDSRTKQTLVYLILAALLINFSLFITKFVVDFTNILASEVAVAGFQQVDDAGDPILGETNAGDRRNVAIGDTFFNLMRITPTVLNPNTNVAEASVAPWSYIFGIGIINIVGAFAFGVGGIMLIIRFVALSVYMVLSPFMFLGWVFPGFQSMSSKYWNGFFKQAFYAPVYIVMIFFAATILNNFFAAGSGAMQRGGIGDLVGSNGFVSSAVNTIGNSAPEFGGGLAPFILSAAFLIAAVQVAGKLASDGSGIMAKVSGGVNARVRGAVRGGGRFAARNTLGYGMSYGVNRAAEARRERLRRRNAALAQSDSRFDRWRARSSERGILAAGLDRAASARIAGSETNAERRTRINSAQAGFNNIQNENQRSDDLASARETLRTSTSEEARKEAEKKIKKALKKMSNDELLNLKPADLNSEEIAKHLSKEQLKALAGSGKLTNPESKKLGETRENAIFKEFEDVLKDTSKSSKELEDAIEGLTKTITTMSPEEASNLSADRLATQGVATKLSEKQLDAIRDSGNLTTEEFAKVKDARKEGLKKIAATGSFDVEGRPDGGPSLSPEAAKEFADKQRKNLVKGSAKDVGKLPPEVFAQPEMAEFITPAALAQRSEDLSKEDQKAIEDNIKQHIAKDERAKKMWKKWSNTAAGVRFNFE